MAALPAVCENGDPADVKMEQSDKDVAEKTESRPGSMNAEGAGDAPGRDQPGADQPGADQPGRDQPGADQPGRDQPGADQPGADQPGRDQPGRDQPGRDQPGADQPGADQPGRDQPGADQPGADQPGADQPGGACASETTPLLVPAPEPDQNPAPMTKQELKAAAGSPGWRKARCYMVLLLWLVWVAMLAASIAFIALSPRPGSTRLKWWQKSLFYRLQPDLFAKGQTEGAGDINAMCEQLPYLKSLGIGALILEGLFEEKSLLSVNRTERFGSFPQIKHLITESNKTGLKLVLDLCELNLLGPHDVSRNTATVQHALRFWLEHGVAGFVICGTDSAYPDEALAEWREVIDEFSRTNEERIVVVKQVGASLPPLNATLVDLVMRPILPSKRRRLSAHEVFAAVETRLQDKEDNIWQSWTIGGKASRNLKRLLLVLMMTMPGSPAVQHDAVLQTKNETLKVQMLHGEKNYSSDGYNQTSNSTAALFSSLSRSRARESALLHGSLAFLPYSTFTNSSNNGTSSSYPVLAFTRSWSCVRILVLLNVGPEIRVPDPDWALGLPEEGVFVASTGMDRMGPTTLHTLELQPHEAVVIKF